MVCSFWVYSLRYNLRLITLLKTVYVVYYFQIHIKILPYSNSEPNQYIKHHKISIWNENKIGKTPGSICKSPRVCSAPPAHFSVGRPAPRTLRCTPCVILRSVPRQDRDAPSFYSNLQTEKIQTNISQIKSNNNFGTRILCEKFSDWASFTTRFHDNTY